VTVVLRLPAGLSCPDGEDSDTFLWAGEVANVDFAVTCLPDCVPGAKICWYVHTKHSLNPLDQLCTWVSIDGCALLVLVTAGL